MPASNARRMARMPGGAFREPRRWGPCGRGGASTPGASWRRVTPPSARPPAGRRARGTAPAASPPVETVVAGPRRLEQATTPRAAGRVWPRTSARRRRRRSSRLGGSGRSPHRRPRAGCRRPRHRGRTRGMARLARTARGPPGPRGRVPRAAREQCAIGRLRQARRPREQRGLEPVVGHETRLSRIPCGSTTRPFVE